MQLDDKLILPKLNDWCKVNYDGRISKAFVTKVDNDTFDVITTFGAEMFNIPFDKFRPLYIIEKQPENLLHLFWQRASDACPLEASEMDEQIKEWEEWVNQIKFNQNKIL